MVMDGGGERAFARNSRLPCGVAAWRIPQEGPLNPQLHRPPPLPHLSAEEPPPLALHKEKPGRSVTGVLHSRVVSSESFARIQSGTEIACSSHAGGTLCEPSAMQFAGWEWAHGSCAPVGQRGGR